MGNPSDGPPSQYTARPRISQGGFLFTVLCCLHSGEPTRQSTYPVYCRTTNISRWVSVHCIVLPPQWGTHQTIHLPSILPDHEYLKVGFCSLYCAASTVGNPPDHPPTQYTAPTVGNPSDSPPTQYTAGPRISQGGFLFTVLCCLHSGEPTRQSTYPVYCRTTNISRWVSVHCIVLPPQWGTHQTIHLPSILPPQWGTHQTVHLPSILPDHEYLKVGFCSLYCAASTVGNPPDHPPTQYTAGPRISQGGFLFTVLCCLHSGEPTRPSTYPVYCPHSGEPIRQSTYPVYCPHSGEPIRRSIYPVYCPHSGEPIRQSTYPVYCRTTNISRWVSVHCIVLPPQWGTHQTVHLPSILPDHEYLKVGFCSLLLYVTITYLVSSRRSIEIWRVCKIYGRRGGPEPSIYFTNPPYFYRPSGTDQISVLFCQGPCIAYAVAKIRKKYHSLHTYTAEFCVRKCDVTASMDNVIDYAVKIKDHTTLCCC